MAGISVGTISKATNGIDRWFLKPINPHQLIHDVAEELGGHRNGR